MITISKFGLTSDTNDTLSLVSFVDSPVIIDVAAPVIALPAGPVSIGLVATAPVVTESLQSSWISTLSDPVLRGCMTAYEGDGALTVPHMGMLFLSLASELVSSGTTLSASQFHDLQTIASNLKQDLSVSAAVNYLVEAVVNGNPANAYFSDNSLPVALGNLQVGSSGAQLQMLAGKWFFGDDLPSDVIVGMNNTPFAVATTDYGPSTLPLFGASGPTVADINQGGLGDCYLLSALAEVASQDPAIIESMITDNGNDTYTVRFFVNGQAEYVTVNNMLANGGTGYNVGSTGSWASLIEKAYAQFQSGGNATGNDASGWTDWNADSYSSIRHGGYPLDTLEEITGAASYTEFDNSTSQCIQQSYNGQLSNTSSITITAGKELAAIVADLETGGDAVVCSTTTETDSSGMRTLIDSHAMSIYGYDPLTGDLEIRNPWGVRSNPSYETTFEVSLSTLLSDNDTIDLANMTVSSVVDGACAITADDLQANSQVSAFSVFDTAQNVLDALPDLTAATKLTEITIFGVGSALSVTDAQYTALQPLMPKLESPTFLDVTDATVAQSTGLQADGRVAAYTVNDTAGAVANAIPALAGDSKMTNLVITGSGAVTLDLRTITAPTQIDLSGNTASASAGLARPNLSFIGVPDQIDLGAARTQVDLTMTPGNGIAIIANFQFGIDELVLNITGVSNGVHFADTSLNGAHAISIYAGSDMSHGVVLTGSSVDIPAALFSIGHVGINGTTAVIV